MISFAGRRLGSGLVTLFLFATLLFFVTNWAVPGDYVTSLGPMSEAQSSALRAELGLDRPLPAQFADWITSVFVLDLGQSYEGGDVWGNLLAAMAPTMLVLTVGLGTAILVGFALGRYAGYRGDGVVTGGLTFIAIVCLTVFPPALAVFMERGVIETVRWRGLGELAHLSEEAWAGTTLSFNQVMWAIVLTSIASALIVWGLNRLLWRAARKRMPGWLVLVLIAATPVLLWSMLGLQARVLDTLGVFSLLILAVVVLTYGEVLLVARAAMDDVMSEDYVTVARAKGLPESTVRDKHAARTALLPVLSRLTVAIPYFFTGLVILEIVFAGTQRTGGVAITGVVRRFVSPPGLGTELFDAMTSQDIPMLLGGLLAVGVLTLVVRIILEVSHAVLDPRISLSGEPRGL